MRQAFDTAGRISICLMALVNALRAPSRCRSQRVRAANALAQWLAWQLLLKRCSVCLLPTLVLFGASSHSLALWLRLTSKLWDEPAPVTLSDAHERDEMSHASAAKFAQRQNCHWAS